MCRLPKAAQSITALMIFRYFKHGDYQSAERLYSEA